MLRKAYKPKILIKGSVVKKPVNAKSGDYFQKRINEYSRNGLKPIASVQEMRVDNQNDISFGNLPNN